MSSSKADILSFLDSKFASSSKPKKDKKKKKEKKVETSVIDALHSAPKG